MLGPQYKLPAAKALDPGEELRLQSFMLVDPSIRTMRGDFAAEVDSPFCMFHARFKMSKDELARLLMSGWSIAAVAPSREYDSSGIQSMIGSAVGWDYMPRLPQEFCIAYSSPVAPNGRVQGLVRPVPSGYVVFIDRGRCLRRSSPGRARHHGGRRMRH